jgi:hypothetical protein
MISGIELIAQERQRQIEKEGWTAEHDSRHKNEELAWVACYYAMPGIIVYVDGNDPAISPETMYPVTWNECWAKRDKKSRTQQLAVAGALIAAEIDRLNKQEKG